MREIEVNKRNEDKKEYQRMIMFFSFANPTAKLSAVGFKSDIVQWIEAFITNRRQQLWVTVHQHGIKF